MKFTNHHVSDLIVRLKNAAQRSHTTVTVPNVKIVKTILALLKSEGYINGYEILEKSVSVTLKYIGSEPVIKCFLVVSKPSNRVYKGVKEIPSFYNGLGTTIVSTPKGILTDDQARQHGVGGEILCQVF